MSNKLPVVGGLRVNTYAVLVDCIERGVESGWHHAHKHTDAPTEFDIRQHIADDLMNEICEYFSFDFPEE